MALIARTDPSLDAASAVLVPPIVAIAAEDIDALAPCGLDANGEIIMSNATAADAPGQFLGVAARAALAGQPVTLFGEGVQFQWSSAGALTPASPYFVGATDGTIDAVATTGDTLGSFVAIDDKVLRVTRTRVIGGAG